MHIPRSDRSLDFIARGPSIGMFFLYIPVVLLTALVGLCIAEPYVLASVSTWVIWCAVEVGIKPQTILLLTMIVPVLQAFLQYSNRRHGIGGGRCLLYNAVFCAPVVFALLYYGGIYILGIVTIDTYEQIPYAAPLIKFN